MRGHDFFKKPIQANILSVRLQKLDEAPIEIDLEKGFSLEDLNKINIENINAELKTSSNS